MEQRSASFSGAMDASDEHRGKTTVDWQQTLLSLPFLSGEQPGPFFQQLVALLPLGVAVHMNGIIMMVNPAAMAMLKATRPEEVVGRRAIDLVHPDFRESALRRIQQLLSQPFDASVPIVPFTEETLLTVTNEPFEAEVAGIRMKPTEEGTPILVLFRDITAQKRQRRALEESEARFRRLVSRLPDGVVIHKNRKIVFVNNAAVEMMGVEGPEALVGHYIHEFLLPEEREYVDRRIQKLMEQWEALPLSKNHLRRPNGETFLAEVRAFPFEDGGEKAVLLVVSDITEMERMRVELEKNEKKFRLLAELLPAIVYIIDSKGQIAYMNPFTLEALGYSPEELRDIDFSTIIDQDDLLEGMKAFRSLDIGESTYYELRVKDKGGRQHWIAVWTTKTVMEDDVIGLGVAMDITWRKEMERALKEHAHQLVKALEDERRRIACELHDEVGQQLIGMKFSIERALRHTQSPTARNALKDVIQQLGNLTEQVRELSLSSRPAMLDNLGLLPTLLWHFKRFSERTGIQVKFNHTGLDEVNLPQPYAITVYRVVQEALTNIARHAHTEEVHVEVLVTNTQMILRIQDEGIGFDPEEALRDFQSSGLRGMKERVHLLSGHLDIQSMPQQGTVITATIPLPNFHSYAYEPR